MELDASIKTLESTKNPYGTSKQHILQASERLFAERGYAQTTLRDVASASGANTALVGYYFGGKEGLRKAVADLQIEKLNHIFQHALHETDLNEIEDLRQLLRELLVFARTDQLLHRLQKWALADGGDFASQMAQSLWNPFLSKFTSVMNRLRLGLTPQEVELRSTVLAGLLQNYADLRWTYLEKLDLHSTPNELLEGFEKLLCGPIFESLIQPTHD